MHIPTLTRRQTLHLATAALGSALVGCGGRPEPGVPQQPETPLPPLEPPPALGWQPLVQGNAGPGPRSRHGLVYDRNAKVAVLFGGVVWEGEGSLQGDTWELRNRTWTRIATPTTPPARHRGAMTYLDSRAHSLLFGGQAGNGDFLGDTWTYAAQNWQRVPGPAPAPRCGHCLAFDEQADVAILFGGIAPNDKPRGDTWLFDGTAWKQAGGKGPPARRYAAFAYDPELAGCVLHGGAEDDRGRRTFGDAWLCKGGTWTRLDRKYDTPPRDDHGLAYHRSGKRLVMLEGLAGVRGVLVREATGWTAVAADPLHPRHQCAPLAWHDELGGLLLYGGEARHGGPQFEQTLLLHLPAG